MRRRSRAPPATTVELLQPHPERLHGLHKRPGPDRPLQDPQGPGTAPPGLRHRRPEPQRPLLPDDASSWTNSTSHRIGICQEQVRMCGNASGSSAHHWSYELSAWSSTAWGQNNRTAVSRARPSAPAVAARDRSAGRYARGSAPSRSACPCGSTSGTGQSRWNAAVSRRYRRISSISAGLKPMS